MIILYLLFGSGAYLFNAFAIKEKDATMASLLEITYPLFIILFTLIFLGQLHLNAAGLAGAVLILTGCILVVFSRGDQVGLR